MRSMKERLKVDGCKKVDDERKKTRFPSFHPLILKDDCGIPNAKFNDFMRLGLICHFSLAARGKELNREDLMSSSTRFLSPCLLLPAALFLVPLGVSAQRLIDFGDLSLPSASFNNGSDEAGGFTSGGATFNNVHDADSNFWGGWSYSNVNDTITPGFGNQYAAITGAGLGPNGIYGVGYVDTFTPAIPRIVLPEGESILGVEVTNTTYVYYSMRDGDAFSKKFGGTSGDDPDFLRLTISGLTASETPTGSVDFHLADYRFENNALDQLVDAWTWVDLGGLGADTRILEFTLASSDNSIWGMNTPAYFALGGVTVIPEPAAFAFWGGLAMVIAILGHRLKGKKAGN